MNIEIVISKKAKQIIDKLSTKPKYKKIMAIALLYAGANPSGIEAAIKFV